MFSEQILLKYNNAFDSLCQLEIEKKMFLSLWYSHIDKTSLWGLAALDVETHEHI